VSVKLAIVGYGKMGRAIETLAGPRGHTVAARFDLENTGGAELSREALSGADVALEFTSPQAAPANIRRLVELGVKVVVGTTGWYGELPEIRRLVEQRGGALVYGPNFSIGMSVFFQLVRRASEVIREFSEYDPYVLELHHKAKKDAPSGTAVALRRALAEGLGERVPEPVAVRAGSIPGTHEVGFDSEADTIRLVHSARNRQGFAAGALVAAERIAGRTGIFEFEELLWAAAPSRGSQGDGRRG
jgi:4-hydroxy-tetrahydrodipicolinate reductase